MTDAWEELKQEIDVGLQAPGIILASSLRANQFPPRVPPHPRHHRAHPFLVAVSSTLQNSVPNGEADACDQPVRPVVQPHARDAGVNF